MKLCWTLAALHGQRQSLESCGYLGDLNDNPNHQTAEKFLHLNRQHFVLPKRNIFPLLLPLFYSSRREFVTIRYIIFILWFFPPFFFSFPHLVLPHRPAYD